jgi:SsrA-binding protein
MAKGEKTGEKMIAGNKRAFHDYHIIEQIEAGISLLGTEVKSLRDGKASIAEGYVQIDGGEAWLMEVHIPPYVFGSSSNHDPFRKRRLLLHSREIAKLDAKVKERGYTIVPLKLYFSGGKVKIMIGLAKGKTMGDKREVMKEKETKRDIERALRSHKPGRE